MHHDAMLTCVQSFPVSTEDLQQVANKVFESLTRRMPLSTDLLHQACEQAIGSAEKYEAASVESWNQAIIVCRSLHPSHDTNHHTIPLCRPKPPTLR